MYLGGFGNCCGANVLEEFPEYGSEVSFKRELKKILLSRKNIGHVSCILDSWQNKLWFPILKEFGFKRMKKFRNPNTGNTLYPYYLIINQPKSKKKVKRLF